MTSIVTEDELAKIFSDRQDPSKIIRERTWFRNILYYLGEQWFDWTDALGFSTTYPLTPGEPTPVSDEIKKAVKSQKAMILSKKHAIAVWPNSEETKDKNAALLATQLAQYFAVRDDAREDDVTEWIAHWMLLTGNGVSRTFPQKDTGKFIINKEGKVVPGIGDVRTEFLIPFCLDVPALGNALEDKAYIKIQTLQSKEWVEDTYNVKITQADSDKRQVDYEKRLMTLIANVSPWKGRGISDVGIEDLSSDDLVVVNEIEWKPTKKFPKGRYLIRVSGKDVKEQDSMLLPIGKDGSWYYSVTHFPYNFTPGSFWATGAVDPLISPQNTINQIDKDQQINRGSLGKPWILTPAKLTLERVTRQGATVRVLRYHGQDARGAKPEVVRGVAYPEAIWREREVARQTIQENSGSPENILEGKAPYSGAPGIAIDTLTENAQRSHVPDIDRFYRNKSKMKRKELIVAQEIYTESRLLKIKGEGNKILVRKFNGADLHNNTDVKLELTSGISTTQAGTTQIIMDTVQYQLWDDRVVPPDIRRELLKRMGLGGFPETANLHRERAERENSLMMDNDFSLIALPGTPIEGGGEEEGEGELEEGNVDSVFPMDNDMIHMDCHLKLILSAEFTAKKQGIRENIIAHWQMHAAALAHKQSAEDTLNAMNIAEGTQTVGKALGGEPKPGQEKMEQSLMGGY